VNGRHDPFGWRAMSWLEVRRALLVCVVLGLLSAGALALLLREDAFLHAKGQAVDAYIVSLSTSIGGRSRLHGPTVLVTVRTTEGLTGRVGVSPQYVRGCSVGDPVSVVVIEGRLRIEPWPCGDSKEGPSEASAAR